MAACTSYSPGSFKTAAAIFPPERTTRGCLDIAIQAVHDAAAEGPVLDVYLGNRCNDAVWVDLAALEVSARLPDGQSIFVGLYDPRDELRAAVLGGRESVTERIEVQAPLESLSLCARLDRVAAAAQAGPPQVLCTEVQGA